MYKHWLNVLPPSRTAVVRLEEQREDQQWTVGMIGRSLGLAQLHGQLMVSASAVDVDCHVEQFPPKPSPMELYTPELRRFAIDALDKDLAATFGYSL